MPTYKRRMSPWKRRRVKKDAMEDVITHVLLEFVKTYVRKGPHADPRKVNPYINPKFEDLSFTMKGA